MRVCEREYVRFEGVRYWRCEGVPEGKMEGVRV